MNINQFIKNNSLKIIVKPNSPKNEIISWDNEKQALRIAIKAKPENNQANIEIIKFFKKLLKKNISIIHGLKSREKIIKIENI
jgi:uncharacterized protein (TIGR00251 family)